MPGGDDGAVVLVVEGSAAEVDETHVAAFHATHLVLL